MNWVLVVVLTWSGTSSEQIGPYASQADCDRAATIIEQQQVSGDRTFKRHYCVPKPRNHKDDGVSWTQPMPKEFD
jgi:hypothetical protein